MSEVQANSNDIPNEESKAKENNSQENEESSDVCQLKSKSSSTQHSPCQNEQHDLKYVEKLEKETNADAKVSVETNSYESDTLLQLKEEVLQRTNERDDFRKKLEVAEIKLSALQSPQHSLANGTSVDDNELRQELEELRSNLAKTKLTLDDRERRVTNQENQISALTKQVSSLKEVVAITKDMLSIRNMEVKHLQEDIDKTELKIATERDRHNQMLKKMESAAKLNEDLKKEYQTQLQLFQDLRGKYEEKVTLLSEENKALESAVQAQPAQ